MAGSNSTKPWEYASAVFGVVSALIATVVAITQQKPASAIAVAIAITFLGGWGVVWIVRAKTAANRPRFPRGRWVALTVSVAVTIGIGIVFIIPGSRAVVNHDILGFPSIGADVKIVNVLVAESDNSYRISIVTRNNTTQEELATRVKLRSKCAPEVPVDRPEVYQIQQDFNAGVTLGEPPVSGYATLAEEPEFRIHVAGQLVDEYCGLRVSLTFGVSVPLPANQHTTIFVDLPKVLRVPDDRPKPTPIPISPTSESPASDSRAPEPEMVELSVDRPSGTNFAAALVVSGVELSAVPD